MKAQHDRYVSTLLFAGALLLPLAAPAQEAQPPSGGTQSGF
jgi:hypothetical protein